MNFYGVRTIETFIGHIESLFKIKILESKVEKFLRKKQLKSYIKNKPVYLLLGNFLSLTS